MTLPLIHARDNLDQSQRQLICRAIETRSGEYFSEILSAVQSAGSLDFAMEQARIESDLAKKIWRNFPTVPIKLSWLTWQILPFPVSRKFLLANLDSDLK